MGQPPGGTHGVRQSGAGQPRAGRDPALAALAGQQRAELATLRAQAMQMVPSLHLLANGGTPDPADDKLLGRIRGVIDGLNTLSLIVTRVIDRERKPFGDAQPDDTEPTMNGREIERCIIDQLDRLLAAEREAGVRPEPDRAD